MGITTLLKLVSPFHWQESVNFFKTKKFVLYIFLGLAIYGVAYVHGLSNKPIHIDFLKGQEARIKINDNEYLHILKSGTVNLEDEAGHKLHTIKVSDIPALQKALMPVGFELKAFATVGGSIGANRQTQPEAGIGVSFFKLWKANIDVWATQYAGYIGADYQLCPNSGPLVGIGRGWAGDDVRIYAGWQWKF